MSDENAIRIRTRAETRVATAAILDAAKRIDYPIGESTARLFAVAALAARAERVLRLLEEGIET